MMQVRETSYCVFICSIVSEYIGYVHEFWYFKCLGSNSQKMDKINTFFSTTVHFLHAFFLSLLSHSPTHYSLMLVFTTLRYPLLEFET
jgi:hypothetical protein